MSGSFVWAVHVRVFPRVCGGSQERMLRDISRREEFAVSVKNAGADEMWARLARVGGRGEKERERRGWEMLEAQQVQR